MTEQEDEEITAWLLADPDTNELAAAIAGILAGDKAESEVQDK